MANKSWREKDRRGGSVRSSRRVHTPTAPRGYKADLDKLFETDTVPDRFKTVMSGISAATGDAERQRLIRAARQTDERAEFQELVTALVNDYTLPEDEKLLMRVLDLDDESLIRAALDGLIEMAANRRLKKRKLLKLRLDTVKQTVSASETLELSAILDEWL